MEIIKVSENSKLIRVKLGDIKPNRFRDLERWPVEREVIDGLKDSIKKEGFWSKSIQAVINEHNEVELRFGHHRLTAAIEMFGSDYETEIDLVEFINEFSLLRSMNLENSVNRNKMKLVNELVYQYMHWFDDYVFEKYPSYGKARLACKNKELGKVVGKNTHNFMEVDDFEHIFSNEGRYNSSCEDGIGWEVLVFLTKRKEAEVKESLSSLAPTERRKRGMKKRAG